MAKYKRIAFASGALALGFMPLAFSTNSFAAVAHITDIDNEADLIGCLEQASEATCTLGGDINLSKTAMVYNKVTLDLNGHSIIAINPENGKFADDGKMMITVNHGADFTVKGNGTISTGETDVYGPIRLTDSETLNESKVAKFTLNDATLKGKYYGISGNGSRHNTEVTVNSGIIESDDTGIFNPQQGSVTLNGGKIEAKLTGIEMRAGTLTVNNGVEINVEDAEYKVNPNGSGTTTTGAAIAIAQHNTKLPISVTINGGSFTAPVPVSEANPQKNDSASIDKVNIKIAGGEFTATNTEKKGAVYSEDKAIFITGGTFSELDKNYIAKEGGYDYATTNDGIEVVNLAALDEEGNELDENHKIVSKKIDYKGETKEAITGEAEGTVAGSVEFIGDVEIDRKGYFVIEDHGTDGLITKATSSDSKLVAAFDLNMYDRDHKIVKVSDTEMKVKIALTEDQYNQLKQYNSVVAVYFDEEGNETEERIAAELVADEDKSYYVVFTVTHFSTYGIIGVNEETTVTAPETGTMTAVGASAANAGILAAATAGVISAIVGIAAIIRRK